MVFDTESHGIRQTALEQTGRKAFESVAIASVQEVPEATNLPVRSQPFERLGGEPTP